MEDVLTLIVATHTRTLDFMYPLTRPIRYSRSIDLIEPQPERDKTQTQRAEIFRKEADYVRRGRAEWESYASNYMRSPAATGASNRPHKRSPTFLLPPLPSPGQATPAVHA